MQNTNQISNGVNENIFKAYDIRGLYPKEINEKIVRKIAKGLRRLFKRGIVVIGRDTRLSSPSLYQVILKEFRSRNSELKVIPAGMITTPMLYFLVNKLKASGGIMVTASHNPKEWNGLKVVGKGAKMISGKEILRIMNSE